MVETLEIAYQIALKRNILTAALRFAIKLDDIDKIK
jgi:hypothetical protein